MPRDASGNYTLPAGNPVVTGTTIDSSWANDTMDDIATELQDSLSRSGDGGMLVAFKNADGTEAAPGITFTNETTTGFYRAGTNDLRGSVAGTDRIQLRADATNPVRIWSGAAWKNILQEGVAAAITADWSFTSTNFTVTAASAFTGAVGITGALTATSYGGITEANLLDKSAVESVAGAWTFTGGVTFTTGNIVAGTIDADFDALTATSYGGITEANLVDLSADEAITGMWTLDGDVTTADFGTGGKVKDGTDTAQPVGFNVMPLYEIDVADDFDLAHSGMYWHTDGSGTIAFDCAADANVPVGATYVIANESSGGVQTITATGGTLAWFDGSGTVQTGTRTLAVAGVCTVYKYSDTEWHIWGVGLS